MTAERLEAKGACDGMVRWFKRRWPKGCETTLKNLTAAAEEDTYNLLWFAMEYLEEPKLYISLDNENTGLNINWNETVEKRIIERAERTARCFILYNRPVKWTQDYLRRYKREHEQALAEYRKTVTAKLARMVYDRVKQTPAKRRKPK